MVNEVVQGYGRCIVQMMVSGGLWHEVVVRHVLVSWRAHGDVQITLTTGFTFNTPAADDDKPNMFRVICFFGPWNFDAVTPFEAKPGVAVHVGPQENKKDG